MQPINTIARAAVIVFCLINNLAITQAQNRSIIEFGEQTPQVSGKRLEIINNLRAASTSLESPHYSTQDSWWQNQELQQPIKCFAIAATIQLAIDLIRCSTQGCLQDLINDPSLFLMILMKVIFQGGIPGAIIGSFGSWGKLPQISTKKLIIEISYAQLLLEFFDRLGADLHRNNAIDSATYFFATSMAIPTITTILHGLLILAEREDLQQEKFLIAATLRELGSPSKMHNAILINEK